MRDEQGQTRILEHHRGPWAHKDGDGFSLKLDYLPLIPGAQSRVISLFWRTGLRQ
ncbi:MAG TPA: hypothetical protein VKS24_15685 [Bradyrhizobium sp.]|nr:hypothetical protein [Bradyrhizobium sp.]